MFTINHLIWILISLCTISVVIVMNKLFKLSLKTNLLILFFVGIVSETIKISVNMIYLEGYDFITSGTYLEYDSLPFHLCSLQLFFVIALLFFIKSEAIKNKLLVFMFPAMCIGALLAILIPTEGVSFSKLQCYEYFIYHGYLIGFGIYLIMSKTIKITYRAMFRNIVYLIGLSVLAIYVNGMLSFARTNFMFVSRPPMENLPYLNLNGGWHIYFLKVVALGIVVMILFHIPFIIFNKERKINNN